MVSAIHIGSSLPRRWKPDLHMVQGRKSATSVARKVLQYFHFGSIIGNNNNNCYICCTQNLSAWQVTLCCRTSGAEHATNLIAFGTQLHTLYVSAYATDIHYSCLTRAVVYVLVFLFLVAVHTFSYLLNIYWWSGVVVSTLALINEVNQCWARLVLRWATASGSIPGARQLFRYLTNQPAKANSVVQRSGVGKWVAAFDWKAKAGTVHSVSGWTWGVQVKLWDPLRTRATPESLRGVFMTRRYTNPRLPLTTTTTTGAHTSCEYWLVEARQTLPQHTMTYLSSSSSSSKKLRRSGNPPILLPGSQMASSLTDSRTLLYCRSSLNDGTSKPSSLRIVSSFSIRDLHWETIWTVNVHITVFY